LTVPAGSDPTADTPRTEPPIAEHDAEPGDSADRPLRDASLVKSLYRDPDHAPEHLVLIAVDKVGAQSQAGAERLRREDPDASPRELGEQVVARTVRFVRTDGG
jgi:hypothetical protein